MNKKKRKREEMRESVLCPPRSLRDRDDEKDNSSLFG
jgi:hypothetical protein